ncbi:MAG: isoprenyl transferase [Clostridiales bacterium]|jgi:undecaprenyl diphosphate synthase|nr:isoprenyl transferase [Eubacteriales bacterium]MDH7564896.1 isoprenyl transferase [Clostridiales bacterium]
MSFFEKLFANKETETGMDSRNIPQHVAIIVDGNGRWANRRGMPRNYGHREGSKNLKKIVKICSEIGVRYLTVYAFSTENWKRPKTEVDALMALLLEYLKNADVELEGENIKIRVIGEKKELSEEIKKEIHKVEESTKNNSGLTLTIALNYGGRDEIVSAVRAIGREIKKGVINPEDIDEKYISQRLYTADIPDPDLIIRTSGEKRISNFLLWQSAYSELWYSDVLWPDFRREHLIQAIRDYQKRNRRYGGI